MKKAGLAVLIAILAITSISCQKDLPLQPAGSSPIENGSNNTANAAVNNDYDVMGEIIEIVGNEMTLKLMEMDLSENLTRVPGSGMGRNGSGSGIPAEKNYTGQELTLIIPVGTPMFIRVSPQNTGDMSPSETKNGPVENEIGLRELTKGVFLKIRYMDDGKTIEKILVQKPRT